MEAKTTYRKKSRIWDKKIREIVRYFAMDFPAVKTSELTGLNPKTTQDWYQYIREAVVVHQEAEKQEVFSWEVELWIEINTDGWPTYDGLVDVGYEKHYRVRHWANEFARGRQHINGIESFWSYTKRRLSKFNGIKKAYFYYFLKESEFRYNCRVLEKDFYKEVLKILRKFNR